jgi:hypothetical protein
MPQSLSDYINDVRLLLHDANGQFYSDDELTRYINKGRTRVCSDTGMYREIRSKQLLPNIEQITLDYDALSVMSIFVLWSMERYPLGCISWQELNETKRIWALYRNYPVCYAQVGKLIYISPSPDQNYYSEWDCPIIPSDGKITQATPINPIGISPGYAAGDKLGLVAPAGTSLQGQGATLQVDSVLADGSVVSLTVISAGTNYSAGDTYAVFGGSGVSLTVTVDSVTSTVLSSHYPMDTVIIDPYPDPVSHWAVYLAKLKDQSLTEASNMKQAYFELLYGNTGSPAHRKS